MKRRPNVVLITADDLNWNSVGAYGCQTPECTPHIDALAAMASAKYGLIFDMDGVIADTEGLNARAAIRVFGEHFGLCVRRADFARGVGCGAEAYMRAAGEAKGLDMPDADLQRAVALRQELFLALLAEAPLPAFPGVLALMEAANISAHWVVAIATGSTEEKTYPVLESARVPYARMEVVTGSEKLARKPDPAMFLAAADRLGVPPSRCVVIEDSPSGVQAAKAAGSACVAVTNSFSADTLEQADLVVDDLREVTLPKLLVLLHHSRAEPQPLPG